MDSLKTAFSLAALTIAAISMKAADAAGPPSVAKPTTVPVKASLPASSITVKIGDAMLEEYRSGDLTRRTQVLRKGDCARAVSTQSTRNTKHS